MSSSSYASRLKEYPNKGKCGLPERFDSKRALKLKLDKLHQLVIDSKKIVVLTGAGISTAAGVPDFRGPNGVWTLELKRSRGNASKKRKRGTSASDIGAKHVESSSRNSSQKHDVKVEPVELHSRRKEKLKADSTRDESDQFLKAQPTLTHRAIAELIRRNIVQYCVTQNVDGLHWKSGIPRENMSILHGCLFTEKCENCNEEYFRSFQIETISFQKTGRICCSCGGNLRDTLLDWEDDLPETDWELAVNHCDSADLVICLGTSLRIEPAGSLPTSAKKFVIVNLQETPKDEEKNCCLIIKARVDDVMKDLMSRLGYEC